MHFLSPALLWFLLAAAVPVIIHLVNRRRHKTISWAAMRFLLSATRQYRGEKKLRHIAILTCRALGLIALAIAVARPVISEIIGWGSGSISAVVLILDRSASMEMKTTSNQSRREAALEKISTTIKNLGNPRLSLIDSASGELQEIASPELLSTLSSTSPTDTAADIPALLGRALAFLTDVAGPSEIWIASDLQSSNWLPSDDRWNSIRATIASMPKAPTLRILSMTNAGGPNDAIRITESRRVGDELLLDVEIHRDTLRKDAPATLTTHLNESNIVESIAINGTISRFQKRIALPNSQSTGHGWLTLAADSNLRDNTSYFVYGPSRKAVSLVVAPPGETADYLSLAAAPPDMNMDATIVSPDQAAQKISPELAAVLWAAPLPDGAAAEAMRRFLVSGGHVCFFAPGTQSSTTFNNLGWSQTSTAPMGKFFTLREWNRDDGPLRDGLDGSPVAAQRLKALRRQILEGDATTLARWEDEQPALVRRIFDHGTAWFLGTVPDYAWSNLGDADVLLPLVQRIIHEGNERFQNSLFTTVGAENALIRNSGTRIRLKIQDDEMTDDAFLAGVEKSTNGLLAINRPEIEDAPESLNHNAINALLQGTRHTLLDQVGKNTDGEGSSEAWRFFLYAMLLFLIAEAILCLNPKAPRAPQATGAPSRG
ncbi:MAG: BatA domain-containing protein [Luteolibacter sp.]